MDDVRLALINEVQRELDELEEVDAAVAAGLAERRRARANPSVVFSLRLDPGEVSALERRAAALGLKPSVLARNLVRRGLDAAGDPGQETAACKCGRRGQ